MLARTVPRAITLGLTVESPHARVGSYLFMHGIMLHGGPTRDETSRHIVM